jgi:hypothetical protein
MTTVKVIVTGYKGASYPLQPMSDSVMMTTPCHRQPPGGNPQQAHLDFSDNLILGSRTLLGKNWTFFGKDCALCTIIQRRDQRLSLTTTAYMRAEH